MTIGSRLRRLLPVDEGALKGSRKRCLENWIRLGGAQVMERGIGLVILPVYLQFSRRGPCQNRGGPECRIIGILACGSEQGGSSFRTRIRYGCSAVGLRPIPRLAGTVQKHGRIIRHPDRLPR